jgi:hypothetical protein
MVEELKAWGAGLGARGGEIRSKIRIRIKEAWLALIPAFSPRRRRNDFSVGSKAAGLAMLATLGLALGGCSSVPHTTIAGKLNGSPFLIEAPKDGDLTGFDLTADSNGVVRVHIDHLAVKMNPDVIGQNGAAQAGIIQATGVVASNITAAAVGAALRAN